MYMNVCVRISMALTENVLSMKFIYMNVLFVYVRIM